MQMVNQGLFPNAMNPLYFLQVTWLNKTLICVFEYWVQLCFLYNFTTSRFVIEQ